MPHHIKVGLFFFALLMATYVVLVGVIGTGIERLAQAREGELQAATLQHTMLRRAFLRPGKQEPRTAETTELPADE